MARKPVTSANARARKTRTREHVIAGQSVAHVEKFIFGCGYTAERVIHDYGYDLNLYTYDASGGVENGNIWIQLKATDNPTVLRDGRTISVAVDRTDLAFWQTEIMPVILIVYDARQEEAYWLYVQEALEASHLLSKAQGRGKTRLHLPKDNVVNEAAIERFRRMKQIVQEQLEGNVKHYG